MSECIDKDCPQATMQKASRTFQLPLKHLTLHHFLATA